MPDETNTYCRKWKRNRGEALCFWAMAGELCSQTEQERIKRIHGGFDAIWLTALKSSLRLYSKDLADLTNASATTIDRLIKKNEPLDAVFSERIDRLVQIALLAEEVFEDRGAASEWILRANKSLGGESPLSICSTELGARQVRRLLHAITSGGVA